MQTRRELLQSLAAAATATLALPAPRARAAHTTVVHPPAKADAIIVLWMAGGMAAPDTFDPKKYKPFEKGLAVKDVISTFPAIPTAIDGVQICDGLPEIAKVLDRGTLIRSHVQPDLGSILHSRHQYHWHTGYVPPQTVACPHIGAWMGRVLGPRNPVMPAFVNIGQRLEGIGENEEIKAFTTAGFFGGEAALVRTVVWTLAARGLHARVAIADTASAARAAKGRAAGHQRRLFGLREAV